MSALDFPFLVAHSSRHAVWAPTVAKSGILLWRKWDHFESKFEYCGCEEVPTRLLAFGLAGQLPDSSRAAVPDENTGLKLRRGMNECQTLASAS
jgi:hypothetical protein